jgi:hypothetical protein
MVNPPLFADPVKLTNAVVVLVNVAETLVGASGIVAFWITTPLLKITPPLICIFVFLF